MRGVKRESALRRCKAWSLGAHLHLAHKYVHFQAPPVLSFVHLQFEGAVMRRQSSSHRRDSPLHVALPRSRRAFGALTPTFMNSLGLSA